MPILTLQRRMFEAGRIRIGQQVQAKGGKTRPAKLSTFRVTSSDRSKIEHVARLFGGQSQPWQNGTLSQWEVVTETDEIDVIVPPTDMAFGQWNELWGGGGCIRRCDGQREMISDQPCMCSPDPAEQECKPTTRLSLMLAQVQGMGLWRLESHGWYAATELAGSVELIQAAAGRGHLLPATLRLDKRTVTRPGQPRRDFAVPVLDVKLPLAQIAQATAGALGNGRHTTEPAAPLPGAAVGELAARTPDQGVPFTPIPDDAPMRALPTVAEQVQKQQTRADNGPKRTSRSAAPIPASGIAPRTVDEARDAAQPDPAVLKLGPLTKGQHKDLTAKGITDDQRHQLAHIVSAGRTDSSTQLTAAERTRLMQAAQHVSNGDLKLVTHDDGPTLVDNDGQLVGVT